MINMRAHLKSLIRDPAAINAAQIIQYTVAAVAGVLAAVGAASPVFMTITIGPALIMSVGIVLAIGGSVGAFSVVRGLWWLERVALRTVAVGWVALLPAAFYYASTNRSPAIWLVLILVVWALCDVFKRYRRIDWAYLDPAK